MFLSKLEIFGFKSFAQKTVVNFSRGVTCIVGPNGCGKTNIVDALRWGLGEQRTSALRSDKMENVIFNGTRNRKSLGMAEVSLTFVNDKGLLPSEYSEINITRRIFRSGESEYLLNKNICRLKDITNLFMDTGMGANAYSVIELKMVETILSNKNEERRTLFEEAAGVNKYKLRRKHTLKKLEDVSRDLTRVNDIISEVERKVNSLERQAKRADKYKVLIDELKEKDLALKEREFALMNSKIENMYLEKEEYSRSKKNIDLQNEYLESKLLEARTKISEIEESLRNKRKELSDFTDKLHKIQQKITASTERKKALERNIDYYEKEKEELIYQLEECENKLVDLELELREWTRNIEEKSKVLSSKEEQLKVEKEQLNSLKNSLKIKNEFIFEKFKDFAGKENQFQNLQKNKERIIDSIEKLRLKIANLSNVISKSVAHIEDLETEKNETLKKLAEAEEVLAQKQKEKIDLEKKLNDLKELEIKEKGNLNALKDKIDFFQTLIDNLEGVSKGSKVLIESEEWSNKEKIILADAAFSEEKYRFALEAALKKAINNLLLETYDDLKKAVEFLKEKNLGKASFFVLGADVSSKKSLFSYAAKTRLKLKAKEISKNKNFIDWTIDCIKAENKWQPFFKKLLERAAIVNDLNAAVSLYQKYPDFDFVTLNGDFVGDGGIITAGSQPKLDETLFGRKQFLEDLKKDFPEYSQRLSEVKKAIHAIEEELDKIDLQEPGDRIKIYSNELANIEKQIDRLEFEKKKANDELDKSQKEIADLLAELNTLEEAIKVASEEIEAKKVQREIEEKEIGDFENKVKEEEKRYAILAEELNQLKVEFERALGTERNIENELRRYESLKGNLEKSISRREKDIENAKSEIESLESALDDYQFEYEDLDLKRNGILSEEEEIEKELLSARTHANEINNLLQQYRKQRDELSDRLSSIEIKLNEYRLKIDNMRAYVKDNYDAELELKIFDDLGTFDYEEYEKEVEELKKQIRNLGPINLTAHQEYEEEKQRLEFLINQRNDLIESEKDLMTTIQEINQTAQNLFLDTFEKIRENFINIFRTLFNPGDEADLKLEEGADPLEAKIEIIAKPKGKRPTSIELLSGGEKTLTAIALLFAIYLVKPSPFCILDEVDAPLDDANIDRFTRIIKQFSKNTQFIVVTHNKRTMEAAENLYGVTMQEEGVSKLVAVKFNEQVQMAS